MNPACHLRQLQDYQRLRGDHLIGAASQVPKMQQALERMNLKFHDVISDLVGGSGLKVVRVILKGGRRSGELLAAADAFRFAPFSPMVSNRVSAHFTGPAHLRSGATLIAAILERFAAARWPGPTWRCRIEPGCSVWRIPCFPRPHPRPECESWRRSDFLC